VDVFPAGEAEELANAIRAMHDEPGRAQGLAVAGAQLVRSRLKWSDVAGGYGAVYREVLEESKHVSVPVYSKGWFRRQRSAVLRSDLADLLEREAAARHLARAAGILVQDGSGVSGRLSAAVRLLRQAGARVAGRVRRAASELGRRA
jgi:hypothetical protein